jgi:predicted ATPase/class 3 adenylate cyclase
MAEAPSGTVTLLFTDIEGSTRLLQRAGDDYPDLLAEHRRLLRAAFESHDGYEVDTEGDAFFVSFASAHDAVVAAEEAQRALAAHRWPEGREIRVRMGLHTGEPRLIHGQYVGLDVHRAARVMAAGHGGQVLLSQSTQSQVNETRPLLDLGEHRLKDLLQPERLFQLMIEELPSDFPALKTLGNRPTNLPTQPNPLIGRESELRELTRLLRDDEVRLLTLAGTGGTGKTRLALQIGAELLEEFRSGVFFVSLAPISDPELVIPTIAQTLSVREVPGEPLLNTLIAYLSEKQMLLVVDNLEQVVDAAPSLSKLVSAAPETKLLITSRARLRLAAEHTYEVPPLALPDPTQMGLDTLGENDAIGLFVARAEAVNPEFVLTEENAADVIKICAQLDGLPLAIELAAARISVLTPQALLRRLDERLVVLTSGARDADQRQRTLRDTIEWSYDLLDLRQQALFARLSVFVGGCRFEAAKAVSDSHATVDTDVLDGLQSLVEMSMLRTRKDSDGEPRFWMLETIREYAAERLHERSETHALRRRHAEYFLRVAEQVEPQLTGAQQAAGLELLECDLDNLRQALSTFVDTGEVELELRMIGALWRFWATRGDRSEGRARIEQALERDWPQPTRLREKALAGASRLAQFQNDGQAAERFSNERLAINQESENRAGIAATLVDLGILIANRGDTEKAKRLLRESRSISHELGETREEARAIGNLGALAWEEGDYEDAARFFGEAIPLLEKVEDVRGIAVSSNGVGRAAALLQRRADAIPYLRRSLVLAHTLGDQHEASLALEGLAMVALQNDEPGRATQLLAQADALRRAVATFATPKEHEEFEHAVNVVRAQLEPAAFDLAWSRGTAMTQDEAVAYALQDEPGPDQPPPLAGRAAGV